jgi:penicillin G amidase
VKRLLLALLVPVAVGLLVLAAVGVGATWWWARASLPPLDGEVRLDGLEAPVEILFDGAGVPHVYAAGIGDVWFAAGVLHARDRLWQMELYRRAASGRLSEIFGPTTLPIDRRLLTLGLRQAAEAEWQVVSQEVRLALTRYADGVNAHVGRSTGRRRPLELQLLGVTPAPWTPIDSLAVGRLLAWRLAENHQAELVRHALGVRFGMREAMRLGGRYPPEAPSVIQGPAGIDAPPAPAPHVLDSDRQARSAAPALLQPRRANRPGRQVAGTGWPPGLEWLEPSARRGSSNNWVISGRRTATGRPLLANDPHLQVELPGVWYEMHLVAATLDVIGVTIPGSPFVIIGHNTAIAWGVTNTGADVQDLLVERLDLARQRYLYKGQWIPVTMTRADIPVRGEAAHPFEIWRTRNGTVFAETGLEWDDAPSWLTPTAARAGERRAFALRWHAAGGMASAFEALNRAGTWTAFTAAIERFELPSQNFVYADVAGNIGYAMSGTLPIRSSGSGALPVDATTGEGEWIDTVNPSLLPRLLNPEGGYITSSNNLIDRSWPGLITRDWAAPYRTTRLHHVMGPATAAELTHASAWQNDVTGLAASAVLAGVEGAIAQGAIQGADPEALEVLERLRAWDQQVDGRAEVMLYQLFEDALWRRTFHDEMGEPLFDRFYQWAGAERPAGLYTIIDDPESVWFDDIGTVERRESRDDIYLLAAGDAGRRFNQDFGGRTRWSDAHAVRFTHPLSAAGAPAAWLFDRGPTPIGGDGSTVMRVSYHRLRPFAAWEAPSWRQVIDVGNWDDTRVILPAGQSGHPLSPHYFDQNDQWRQGGYRQQPFSRAAVLQARAHRLVLVK